MDPAEQSVSLVLGTAGHIDHGKTSVVKALTGVDTDRLPEEKQREIVERASGFMERWGYAVDPTSPDAAPSP